MTRLQWESLVEYALDLARHNAALAGVEIGRPETLTDQLRPYLSSLSLFPLDLYETGVAQKAEAFLREMIAGPGAARATVERYMG